MDGAEAAIVVGEGRALHGGDREVPAESRHEPEREPEEVAGHGGRNPPTYRPLTRDELDGTRYPGHGIDLQPFSDYERMARLSECLDIHMKQAVVESRE